MDCQVRNLSTGGAKVTFSNTAAVPDQFDLKIAPKERSFRARMIWRTPNEAGVSFLSEYNQDVPLPLEWAKRLKKQPCASAFERKRRRLGPAYFASIRATGCRPLGPAAG